MHAISVRRLLRASSSVDATAGESRSPSRSAGAVRAPERRALDLADLGVAAEREREVELGEQAAQHVFDPGLAVERKPPDVRAPDADRVGAQRERLEDVGAGADAAVEQQRELAADGFADAGQRIERTDRAVDLAAAVV